MALVSSFASTCLLLLLLATVVKETVSQTTKIDVVALPPWDYDTNSSNGPDRWSNSYQTCGGLVQSPINIEVSQVAFDPLLSDFSYINYDNSLPSDFEISNTGDTIQVSTPSSGSTISGGGLTASYTLAQIHFHWGKDDRTGSEHLIDGKASPLEIHLVHWNEKYSTFQQALNYSDGLSVLAVFVQVNRSSDSSILGNLTTYFDEISHSGNTTTVPSFALKPLLPEDRSFFRYEGSLTTPPCQEGATWTLFHHPIYLNEKEMAAFRSTYDSAGKKLVQNFRPPQPLNRRVVYSSIPSTAKRHHLPTTSTTVLATLSVVVAIVPHHWIS